MRKDWCANTYKVWVTDLSETKRAGQLRKMWSDGAGVTARSFLPQPLTSVQPNPHSLPNSRVFLCCQHGDGMSRRRTRLYATDASSQPETYGRNRQSIADLEQELYDIFQDHPQCQFNDSNEPVIPGDALVDVLRTFSQGHNALELMTRDEEEQLTSLIASNPGLQVTPQVLIQFIAMQTTVSPHHSPDDSPPQSSTAADFDERGRSEDRDYDGMNSRSSSRDSTATYYRSSSRGPPPPPKTPFDSGRRQRTTPLNNNIAPSSWSRRPPPSRRKSDAGHSRALSDSEVCTIYCLPQHGPREYIGGMA